MVRWAAWGLVTVSVGAFFWAHVTSGPEVFEAKRLELRLREVCADLRALQDREYDCGFGTMAGNERWRAACRRVIEEARALRAEEKRIVVERDDLEISLGWKASLTLRRTALTCVEQESRATASLLP